MPPIFNEALHRLSRTNRPETLQRLFQPCLPLCRRLSLPPRGTDCKRPLIPVQPNTSVNPLGVRTRSRRHAILVLTGTFHQNRYLQRIQLATNNIRAHLMTQQPQSIPHMLHTAKRHIADGNVRPHPLWLPMVNRPDLQIMLVGAKTRFNLPQTAITSYQLSRIAGLKSPGDNAMNAVPPGGFFNLVLIHRHLSLRKIQKPRISALAHRLGLLGFFADAC